MYAIFLIVFIIGYAAIALEHPLKVDKTASALALGAVLWVLLVWFGSDFSQVAASIQATGESLGHVVNHKLMHHVGEIAQILFFLLGAMAIVEIIDSHRGFDLISKLINTQNAIKLLWIISLVTFFLSAILDNLTTTIVMITILRKLISELKQRWLMVGMIIIAANAGGAWSPMGDVTTTMLWIGQQISALAIMKGLFIPSLVCLLVPLVMCSFMLRNNPPVINGNVAAVASNTNNEGALILGLGLGSLFFVPVFKTVTHLPPFLGVLFGLSLLWITTALMHRNKEDDVRNHHSISGVISRIDTASVLFFLGILLAVSALATSGHLLDAANYLKASLGNVPAIAIAIGLLSAIVDNVPLVAGAMAMYPVVSPEQLASAGAEQAWLANFVTDGVFWQFLAYTAGTGGSCLIIGSAAGVVAMGMEKIDFVWYLKRVSLLALAGYAAGCLTYVMLVV